ncbi:MAG TPA: metallophosphoesterase [Candidatus Thermoplasmatota archaeon]|nr:metallophosphoesterase [Candidatus Thermoplasmatota archaeon]
MRGIVPVVLLFLAIVVTPPASAEAVAVNPYVAAGLASPWPPEQLRVALAGEDGRLVVQWALNQRLYLESQDPPSVLWRTPNATWRNTTAFYAGHYYHQTGPVASTNVYAATLPPIPPGTLVGYKVGSKWGGYSAERQAYVPPANGEPFRFVAYADIGYNSTNVNQNHTLVRPLVLAADPDLVILAGDLAYSNAAATVNEWMRFMEPVQSRYPTMPALGNHEYHPSMSGYLTWLNAYVLPGDEQSYSYKAGPVTFIALNSDMICNRPQRTSYGSPTDPDPCVTSGHSLNATQLAWLESALAAAAADETPWTVVYHHHPAYSHGAHKSDWAVRKFWEPLYARYGVDVVFTAHDHHYARTYPVIGGVPQVNDTNVYAKGVAPIYVVTGGGGRPLYNFAPPPFPAWHACGAKANVITVVDIDASGLHFRAIRPGAGTEAERTLDAFDILVEGGAGRGGPPGTQNPASLCPAQEAMTTQSAAWVAVAGPGLAGLAGMAVVAALWAARRGPRG